MINFTCFGSGECSLHVLDPLVGLGVEVAIELDVAACFEEDHALGVENEFAVIAKPDWRLRWVEWEQTELSMVQISSAADGHLTER